MIKAKHLIRIGMLAILVVGFSVWLRPGIARAAVHTFTVNSTADDADANLGDNVCETATPGQCTLRAAIEEANANGNPSDQDIINFNISGAGLHIILATGFNMDVTQNVFINGYSQPGASVNTAANPLPMNGTLLIEVDGSAMNSGTDVISFSTGGDNSKISGLVINNSHASAIRPSATNVVISGNYLNLDPTGLINEAGTNLQTAVHLTAGAEGTIVGGTAPADRNVLAGDGNVVYSTCSSTVYKGNFFNVGANGTANTATSTALPVVAMDADVSNTQFGGNSVAAGNLVANGASNGIQFNGGTSNHVEGNTVRNNTTYGIDFTSNAGGGGSPVNNVVGGVDASYGNLVTGNGTGVVVEGAQSTGNLIKYNRIGTNAAGTAASANGTGISLISGSVSTAVYNNLVSGNTFNGINLSGVIGTIISGNYVGTNAAGTAAIANAAAVAVGSGSIGTLIGGTTAAERNILSGSSGDGIVDNGTGTTISGNYIGTNAAGTAAITNGGFGVKVNSASANAMVGGTTTAARNVISGNTAGGVQATGENTTVAGNYIGTNATATDALPNSIGVVMGTESLVGGTTSASRNIISGNATGGIAIVGGFGTPTGLARVQNNYIGTNASGDVVGWSNQALGILMAADALGSVIGGDSPSLGNLIRGNGVGVQVMEISPFQPQYNSIMGNSIYDNTTLGIDLCIDSDFSFQCDIDVGPTPNDTDDPDPGPNQIENFPVITDTSYSGTSMTATFDLDAADSPGGLYHVEFFASDTPDPSGYGQGQTYLGFANVSDGTGRTASLIAPSGYDFTGKYITAITTQYDTSAFTATGGYGSSSEFSQSVLATAAVVPDPGGGGTSGGGSSSSLPGSLPGVGSIGALGAALGLFAIAMVASYVTYAKLKKRDVTSS